MLRIPMLRFFNFALPSRRLLGLLVLALAVLIILLTIATPARAGYAQARPSVAVAARTSSSQPMISSPPPTGVMGPSQRAAVRLKP